MADRRRDQRRKPISLGWQTQRGEGAPLAEPLLADPPLLAEPLLLLRPLSDYGAVQPHE